MEISVTMRHVSRIDCQNDVLKDLGKSGYGDNRQYGNYGD